MEVFLLIFSFFTDHFSGPGKANGSCLYVCAFPDNNFWINELWT